MGQRKDLISSRKSDFGSIDGTVSRISPVLVWVFVQDLWTFIEKYVSPDIISILSILVYDQIPTKRCANCKYEYANMLNKDGKHITAKH